MALSDPQSVVLSTVTIPLPRVATEKSSAVYTSTDGTVDLTVSHQYGRRNRSIIRIDRKKITANPLNDVRKNAAASVYILVDRAEGDFTATELGDMVKALVAYAVPANVDKVLTGQS